PIEVDLQLSADGGSDLRQYLYGGADSVQLPATVIGNHNPVDTQTDKPAALLGPHNALHDQRTRPQIPQPGEVIPADRMPNTGDFVLNIPQARLRRVGTAPTERQPLSQVHEVCCPDRMGSTLKQQPRPWIHRRLHLVPDVALP